jgi:opacity protein-like surface antigen
MDLDIGFWRNSMKRLRFFTTAFCVAGLLSAWPAAAQNNNHLTFNIGAGFTEPVRHTDGRVDVGYNINAGAGINLTPAFGVIGEFGYNHFALASPVLNAAGVPDGNARLYSLTLNPIVRFNPHGRFDVYAIGGGGYYRRTMEFTAPTIATITAFDPFFGVFFPAAVPANTSLGSFTQNKAGWNVGAGFTVQMKGDSNAKFFAESRYHHVYTTPVSTSMLPVTFGFRW